VMPAVLICGRKICSSDIPERDRLQRREDPAALVSADAIHL
jgi:hypothetical protein